MPIFFFVPPIIGDDFFHRTHFVTDRDGEQRSLNLALVNHKENFEDM